MKRILSLVLAFALLMPIFPAVFVTASAVETSAELPTGKTGRTLYTDDMVAAARENIEKYDWAKSERDSVVAAADKFVELGAEYIWNNIPGQGLPRAYAVAFENGHPVRDPYEFHCRYCNTDLLEDHGNYPWTVDAINNPWKIKCPECEKVFPSNDFGKFYELGRTKANGGLFDRVTALEAHRAMLIEKDLLPADAKAMTSPGEDLSASWYKYYGYGVAGGYLHNDLYPEVGTASSDVKFTPESGETTERWGVDDGLGYNTGRVYDNGLPENHSYIAYYNHFGVWYFSGTSIVGQALKSLGRAYLYTGDEKYGRLGAIILDRVADIYPSLNLKPYTMYPNSTGGSSDAGKDLGRIWGCFSAEIYAESYDIFYPMYDDPEVIVFLSEKAEYYGMENDKTTAEKIRKNVADGTCREIFEACKKAWLYANFGIHQQSIIKAAIALDETEETKAMIDWAFAASKSDAHTYNTGGDISRNIVDIVYRDGQNAESPVYNQYAVTDLMESAVALDRYMEAGNDLGQQSLLSHPKYIKMINSYIPLVLTRRGLKGTGDTGAPAEYAHYPTIDSLIAAFNATKDAPALFEENLLMAQQLALRGVSGRHYDIFTPNPNSLQTDVQTLIDKYGQYDWDKSSIMTGYGYAVLRDGTVKSVSYDGPRDTQRDFMLNFSAHPKHNHADWLDLGMEAYGIPFTSDFGYAEFMVTGDPHSNQLTSATIGHNTVVVNEVNSATPSDGVSQYPLHFDAKDTRVKVMDARTPVAYASQNVDEYRRTVVMVDFDDEVSYGIDFFRVTGGSDHLYTFMPNSITRPESNLSFVKQVDQPQASWKDEKNYYMTSSYAGPTVQFGRDPLKTPTSNYNDLKYPRGYTWFYDVERCDNPGTGEFYVDYKIEDFRNISRNGNINPRLRITMLNDFDVNEVSLVSTLPQRIKANDCIDHFEKVFIRRKGENLDSLFTAVYEPYRGGNRYVEAISSVSITPLDGTEAAGDEAKAVKVELEGGRVDYVVYATNKDVTYKVTDTETGYSFDFRGFVGVWTIDSETGNNTYSYLNDGDMIGTGSGKIKSRDAALTGTVTNFQKELSFDNWADVTFDEAISESTAAELVDRMVIFDRSVDGTGAYLIEGVTVTGDNTARISLGSTSTIDGFVDAFDESKGYKYIIEQGERFSIPMSYEAEPYDGKLNYVFSHDAHFSSKGNGGGSTYTDVTMLSFDDTDPAVSTGAWGNLDSRNKQSLYAAGMSSSLSVHRNGDFINLAFDPATYNSADGYYTYYSRLKETSASPIAMIALDVPKTGRYAPSMSALATSSSGQVFEVYLIKETDTNKTLAASQIRENLSLDDRIGKYDSSVGGLQKFGDHDLASGTYYLAFVPVERGEKTGSKNNGQVYLQPTSFHLDPVKIIDTDPYNPDALGGDGKLVYNFGVSSFNSANKVYDSEGDATWYFGDTVQNINDYYAAVGGSAPANFSSPLNTWTDQSAEAKAKDKYIPWVAGASITDTERGHVVWLRSAINPYLHHTYSGVHERNYDYLNLNNTDKWQYIAYMGNLDRAQIYSYSGKLHNQIKANGLRDLGKGNECTILKVEIPSAAQYDFSIATSGSNHVGFAAYLLPATEKLPQTYAERLPYQIALGEWDANANAGSFTAYTAGEYYFIIESFKTEDTTTPSVGRWDVDLRSLTLTATGPAVVAKSAETVEKETEKAFTADNPKLSLVQDTSATVTVLARETSDEDTADKELLERVIEKTTVEKAGDICTVEAPEIEGYTFRYWGVGLGRMMMPVSTETEYSFKAPKGNTFISAFYSYDEAEDSVIEFYNANGEVISRRLYKIGDVIDVPELPSLTGVGDAIGWIGYINGIEEPETFTPDDEIIAVNPIMTFTAAYDEEEVAANKNIVITAEGSTGITGAGEFVFGDEVTLTAPYRQNGGGYKIFVGWKKEGEIVSTDLEYTFNAANDTTVTAVYAGFLPTAVEKVRKILVSALGDNATVAEFIGCDGAIERGFIFDGKGVEDATYKYPMKTDATSFTMTYDTGLLPKAYAIFSDGVIYSE